jgi:hypothetical protein
MTSFEDRLTALEARIKKKSPDFRLLLVGGCLPGQQFRWAEAGDLRWQREEESGEELEQFAERVVAGAQAAGRTSATIGGLPGVATEQYEGHPDFETWWLKIGSIGYSDVPPCEEVGYSPRRSQW